MRRRRDAGGVAGAARGIEADPARRQVGPQIGGEVTGGAIVGADQQRRPAGEAALVLEQGRQQQRPQHRRGANLDRLPPAGGLAHAAAERVDALVLGCYLHQGTKTHDTQNDRIERIRRVRDGLASAW